MTPSTTRLPADSAAVLALFHDELEFADGIARACAPSIRAASFPLEDLMSFAREALLHAARTYDEQRGIPFRAWASLRVRGAVPRRRSEARRPPAARVRAAPCDDGGRA